MLPIQPCAPSPTGSNRFLLTLAHFDEAPAAMATLPARLRDDETLFRLDVALLAAGPAVPVD